MSTAHTAGGTDSRSHGGTRKARYRREDLDRASAARALLLRGFSHDMKNALGATDSLLELIELGLRGPLAPAQQEGLQSARRALRAATRLLHDMFDAVRVGNSQIDVKRESTDIRACLHDVVEEHRAGAEIRRIIMNTQIPAQLPMVDTDAGRVRQIVENLLTNALKFTPAGGEVCVRAGMRQRAHDTRVRTWLVVDVADNGPGIAPRHQKLAFQEFARLGSVEVPGAGIGLAISQRVATALGGRITLHSEPGNGATFTLWLPAVLCTQGKGSER